MHVAFSFRHYRDSPSINLHIKYFGGHGLCLQNGLLSFCLGTGYVAAGATGQERPSTTSKEDGYINIYMLLPDLID